MDQIGPKLVFADSLRVLEGMAGTTGLEPAASAVTEQQIYVFPMTWRTTTALKAIEILEPNRWCVSRYTVPQIRVGDRHIPADISTEL